jgi:hypothetical protein
MALPRDPAVQDVNDQGQNHQHSGGVDFLLDYTSAGSMGATNVERGSFSGRL